jgi:hypothetical protein
VSLYVSDYTLEIIGFSSTYAETPEPANCPASTLEIWANRPKYPDEPAYEYKNKISDFGLFFVRDQWAPRYGGPLLEGINEIVGDFFNLQYGHDHGTVEALVRAIARLPDDRVLFAFEAWVKAEV